LSLFHWYLRVKCSFFLSYWACRSADKKKWLISWIQNSCGLPDC
jgi:hypothetical protein